MLGLLTYGHSLDTTLALLFKRKQNSDKLCFHFRLLAGNRPIATDSPRGEESWILINTDMAIIALNNM